MKRPSKCCMSPALFLLLAAASQAGTLNGSVVGINGAPRPLVRVEIHGSKATTLFTDGKGKFAIDLPAGKYIVQVIQSERAATFDATVPETGTVVKVFKLSW
jgi:hypothetical protein